MKQDVDRKAEAQFRIKTVSGEVEVAGPVEFVEQRWSDVQAALLRVTEKRVSEPAVEFDGDGGSEHRASARRVAAPRKKSGPSCAFRILGLVEDNYFSSPRRAGEIGARLTELATPYASKHVAAALNHLTKSGKLRRLKGADGDWNYVKP